MKKCLVLGTGSVAGPLINYLLNYAQVTVSDVNQERAKSLVEGQQNGKFLACDINQASELEEAIAEHDVVVSLLPPPLHPKIARACLKKHKHLVTASYISPEMMSLHEEAQAKGLVFLNEVGLDPGLDHMTVMEVLDQIQAKGGKVTSFSSHAGGLPARSAANNALRYKFSWNPRGVLGALTRPSKFKSKNRIIEIEGPENLEFAKVLHLPGVGVFESNPNADSLYYAEKYGLQDAHTVRRGTLRFPGWGVVWRFMIKNGLVDQNKILQSKGQPAHAALCQALGVKGASLWDAVEHIGGEVAPRILEVFEELGLFSDQLLEQDMSAFDILLIHAQKSWQFAKDEVDWVVMAHEFHCDFGDRQEIWKSSLIREGEQGGDSAMALTVGIPCAVATQLVLDNQIQLRGVLSPLDKSIYQPILAGCEKLGISHTVEHIPC